MLDIIRKSRIREWGREYRVLFPIDLAAVLSVFHCWQSLSEGWGYFLLPFMFLIPFVVVQYFRFRLRSSTDKS